MPTSFIIGKKAVPVLYCDIDGTIRLGKDELGHFVNTKEDVKVFDEVPSLLFKYKMLGWKIIGVSNQGGIALGYMEESTCKLAMEETQKQTNFSFNSIRFCPHHPLAKDPEMVSCWCRKPKAGLVIEGALSLSRMTGEIYPPYLGLFVGDRLEDMACAEAAGLRFMAADVWRTGKHLDELT
jgi:D-glycero-D-manno-heptose 1,7-bisphosphate phosphatase